MALCPTSAGLVPNFETIIDFQISGQNFSKITGITAALKTNVMKFITNKLPIYPFLSFFFMNSRCGCVANSLMATQIVLGSDPLHGNLAKYLNFGKVPGQPKPCGKIW